MAVQQPREWDHEVTYTLQSGQRGHIILRLPEYPKDPLIKQALSNYGIEPSDVKEIQWKPVPSVRQSEMFANAPARIVTGTPPPLAQQELRKGINAQQVLNVSIFIAIAVFVFLVFLGSS